MSDSETSTGSISGLSESSEIRLLFANLHNTTAAASTENNRHYNQLKVREGSRVGERTRRILHRPSHLESDTSSSSLAESSESLCGGAREGGRESLCGGGREGGSESSKLREREHYDKLKLNLDNLSSNKRALSGEI